MRALLRNMAYQGIKGAGLLPRLRRRGQGPLVFYWHGVEPALSDPRVQPLHTTLEQFRREIDLIRRTFKVISADQLAAGLAQPERLGADQVLLTFDDGFANNLEHAAPLLKSWGLPFLVFVSTRHMDEVSRWPTYYVRAAAWHSPESSLRLDSIAQEYTLATDHDRKQAVKKLTSFAKNAALDQVELMVADLKAALPPERWQELDSRFSSDRPMNWDQVRELSRLGATIGSHTHDHMLLHGGQAPDEVERQLKLSQERIEREVGPCRYFSYPNGRAEDISPLARELCQKAGYELAFSTMPGEVTRDSDPFCLPRVNTFGNSDPDLAKLDIFLLRRDRLAQS